MGGNISSVQSDQCSAFETVQVSFEKAKLRSNSILRVRMFALFLLKLRPSDLALVEITNNVVALNTFVKYAILNFRNTCDAILDVSRPNFGFQDSFCTSSALFHGMQLAFVGPERTRGSVAIIRDFANEIFPSYLRSSHYSTWKREEEYDLLLSCSEWAQVATTLPELHPTALDITLADISIEFPCDVVNCSVVDSQQDDQSLMFLSAERTCSSNSYEPSLMRKMLNSCHQTELPALLKADCWLLVFIASAETLPIGITVSRASRKRRFPLIYVNDHFARLAGSSRDELVGSPCRFMTTGTGHFPQQRETVKSVVNAVKTASAKVAVLNSSRPNGHFFKNVVAVSPVVDALRRYRFLITLQLESKPEKLEDNLRMMHKILDILPCRLHDTNYFPFPFRGLSL